MINNPNNTPIPDKMRYTTGMLPSLDGWRAVSVILVLFAHGHPPSELRDIAFFCGSIGVRFFFVISGFLITLLLLRENNFQGKINLVAFYKRRAFRILPVYYFFLLIYAIAEFQNGIHISAWQWVANLTFTANYSEAEGPTGHLWTLGVEEQFYVIWPLVFLLLTRTASPLQWNKRMIGALTVVMVICPIIRGWCYVIPKDEVPWLLNPFSFLRHADEIGWGCMAAVCFWTKPKLWDLLDSYKYLISIAGISMILAPWFTGSINGFNLINVPLGPSMQSFGYAALMLCSISNDQSPLFRWLNFRPLALLGTLSYSLYIWHTLFVPQHADWPTLTFGRLDELPWWPLMALTMAACSFWGLEKPFLSLRKKFTPHR